LLETLKQKQNEVLVHELIDKFIFVNIFINISMNILKNDVFIKIQLKSFLGENGNFNFLIEKDREIIL
jgi:hypothetical protein